MTPSVDEYLSRYPGVTRALCDHLRTLLLGALPDVSEAVKPGWRVVGFHVVEGKKNPFFAYLEPREDRVVLGFAWGALMTDPAGLLSGDGRQMRQVVFSGPDEIDPAVLEPMVVEAAWLAASPQHRPR